MDSDEKLLQFLENLDHSDFTKILSRLPEATTRLPENGTYLERVASLIRYVCSSAGPGKEELVSVLASLFPKKFPPQEGEEESEVTTQLKRYLGDRYAAIRSISLCNSVFVYRAFDTTLSRYVAIKVFVENPLREIVAENFHEAVQISDERGFITVYDGRMESGLCYYVMRFIDGSTLREHIVNHRIHTNARGLDLDAGRRIFLTIGYTLIRAFKKGYFPGNIKPSNILITRDDQPFLSPLNGLVGLSGASLLEDLEKRWPLLDKQMQNEELAYLLPENFENFENRDDSDSAERSAQYMLGLIAYEMITGELPPTVLGLEALKKNGSSAFRELLDMRVKRPTLPKRLEEIIRRMTSYHPKKRYSSLAEALLEISTVDIELHLAQDSYDRCLSRDKDQFFKEFYVEFQNICPAVTTKFEEMTKKKLGPSGVWNWPDQHKKLENAIFGLLSYRRDAIGQEHNILTATAISHSQMYADIPANFYDFFVEALIHIVCGYPRGISPPFDPECNELNRDVIEAAWRESLKPGIQYMTSKYFDSPPGKNG